MKYLIFILMVVSLCACKLKISTQLEIENGRSLSLTDVDKRSIVVPAGYHDIKLFVDEDRNKPVVMNIKVGSKKREVEFKLPNREDLFYSNEPLFVSPEDSMQNVQIVITRQPDIKDLFTIFFIDNATDKQLAKIRFRYEAKHINQDQSSGSFLESYQKVVKKNRGTVFLIDGNLDGKIAESIDFIVNYSGKFYALPWIETRYKNIKWVLGDQVNDEDIINRAWDFIINSSSVIDYFSYVHAGHQWQDSLKNQNKLKPSQLRLVYTGACSSRSSSRWISEYGAAAGVGHRSTSASPLYQFAITKNWIYGMNLGKAVKRGWHSGNRKAKAMGWTSFAKFWQEKYGFMLWSSYQEMIEDSEPMVSHISELSMDKISIDQSAVRTKNYTISNVISAEEQDDLYEDEFAIVEYAASDL